MKLKLALVALGLSLSPAALAETGFNITCRSHASFPGGATVEYTVKGFISLESAEPEWNSITILRRNADGSQRVLLRDSELVPGWAVASPLRKSPVFHFPYDERWYQDTSEVNGTRYVTEAQHGIVFGYRVRKAFYFETQIAHYTSDEDFILADAAACTNVEAER